MLSGSCWPEPAQQVDGTTNQGIADRTAQPHNHRVTRTRLAILGSTGSIGTQALSLLPDFADRFEVVCLQARSQVGLFVEQISRWQPRSACLTDVAKPPPGLPRSTNFFTGAKGVLEALTDAAPDVVINAITGAAGLPASEWTLQHGKRLLLANKESLVMAGAHLMPLVAKHGGSILPIDSEHCAIHQCLHGEQRSSVRRIWLTGSGGPFRQRPLDTFATISPAEALCHPTWNMGPRITIGSASMMNKAFEIIEAYWLFGLTIDQIKVVIHPQSIVHSMVEFIDGSMLAQCGLPDMRVPILYCLGFPSRLPFDFQPFDPTRWRSLEFTTVEPARYPAIELAFEVLRRGGDSGAVLNAADEELTRMFLAGTIPFTAIAEIATRILQDRSPRPIHSLACVIAADAEGRNAATALVASAYANDLHNKQPAR